MWPKFYPSGVKVDDVPPCWERRETKQEKTERKTTVRKTINSSHVHQKHFQASQKIWKMHLDSAKPKIIVPVLVWPLWNPSTFGSVSNHSRCQDLDFSRSCWSVWCTQIHILLEVEPHSGWWKLLSWAKMSDFCVAQRTLGILPAEWLTSSLTHFFSSITWRSENLLVLFLFTFILASW